MDENPAASIYEGRLDVRPRARLLQVVAVGFWVALSALTMGRLSAPVPDVVVRRRADTRELLRLDADSEQEAEDLLHRVRADLEKLGAAAFCTRWNVQQPV